MLHALGHAVIATDPRGTVLFWNGAAEQLYGWPAAEAVGRDVTEVTVPEVSQLPSRFEERERILEAVHSEMLQDLFAAMLELDHSPTRAEPPSAARIDAARGAVGRAMTTLRDVVKP